MAEAQEIIPTDKSDLIGNVADLFAQGYRLVQIGATTLASAYELNYSFDKDYRFKNLRLTVLPDDEIQSISVIYPSAFLYENEISDLFGVKIRNINVDYHGTLYRTTVRTPYSIEHISKAEPKKKTQKE